MLLGTRIGTRESVLRLHSPSGVAFESPYLTAAEQALRRIDPAELERLLDEAIVCMAQREWPA